MSSIFNITREYLSLIEQLEEAEGMLTPELEESLKITEEDFEQKVVDYGWAIKYLESDKKTIDEEIKRLQAIKKGKERVIDRLKESATSAMRLFDKRKVDSATLIVSLRKSEAVVIEDESKLTRKFLNKKITITPDKKLIKETLKAGKKVNGAFLQENENLQLK